MLFYLMLAATPAAIFSLLLCVARHTR